MESVASRAMSKLGEVVFCVDCDRNAELRRGAAVGEEAAAPIAPRRMAVKKDANGDRLCVPCLDLRRTSRNAAFVRQEARAQTSSEEFNGARSTNGVEAPARPRILRIASAVRIDRSRARETAAVAPSAPPASAPVAPRAPASPRARRGASGPGKAELRSSPMRGSKVKRAMKPERKAAGPVQERAFARLAAEIGFVRTRALLEQLKQKLRLSR